MILIEIESVTAEAARVYERLAQLEATMIRLQNLSAALQNYGNMLDAARKLHRDLACADATIAREALTAEVTA